MPCSPHVVAGLVTVALVHAGTPASSVAAPHPQTDVQIIVKARPAGAAAAVDDLGADVDVAALHHLPGSRLTTVVLPAADAPQALARLNADPRVEYAEPDAWLQAAATPSDPYYPQQWGPAHAKVEQVWDTTRGDPAVTIAVIDSGVNRDHPDFAGATFLRGRNYVAGGHPNNTDDDNGHGTAVTGVIGAQHNSIGSAGICPRCAIMPLKALDSTGAGSHAGLAAAVDYAVANGARVINISIAGTESGSTQTLPDAIRAAAEAGVLVFAAAGNAPAGSQGSEQPHYPAAFAGALGVAGSDAGDAPYEWTNSGSWVVFAAPGCTYGPKVDGGYGPSCGTSYATPLAAGIAGLLASTSMAPDGSTLDRVLQSTAKAVPYVRAGRVDAAAALAALGGPGPSPTPSPPPPSGPDGSFEAPVTREAAAGETVHTDGAGAQASAQRPLQVALTTPRAGTVSIRRRLGASTPAPDGFDLLGVEAGIQAPAASTPKPVSLQFRVHDSVLGERDGFGISVLRDAREAHPCTGDGARPDPCLASVAQAGSDIVLTVRTSRASTWNFAFATVACPGPAKRPPYRDVSAANAHAAAITCAAQLDVARGVGASRFRPARTVTRGQMATFISNMLAAAGAWLEPGPNAFSDDDGHPHEPAINQLAAAGLVSGVGQGRYAPAARVRREQMATFLVRAYEYLARGPLPAGGDAFVDDDGRVHEPSINTAAAAGFVAGRTATTFAPRVPVRRDQMASFLVRVLDRAVADGFGRRR